jgi:hypothetical protein
MEDKYYQEISEKRINNYRILFVIKKLYQVVIKWPYLLNSNTRTFVTAIQGK